MLKKNIKMLYVELSMLKKWISTLVPNSNNTSYNDWILSYKGCMISYLAFEIGYTA